MSYAFAVVRLKLSDWPGGECSGQARAFYHLYFPLIYPQTRHDRNVKQYIRLFNDRYERDTLKRAELTSSRLFRLSSPRFLFWMIWTPCVVKPFTANDKFTSACYQHYFYAMFRESMNWTTILFPYIRVWWSRFNLYSTDSFNLI